MYREMKRWVYYQPNDKDLKDEVADCAIRALTKIMGKSWLEVFDELYKYARKAQCLPNHHSACHPYMIDNGWKYTSIPKGKKVTVDEFARTHNEGTYNLYVRVGYRTHYTAVSDGKYFDTWDSGTRLIYGYWSKED